MRAIRRASIHLRNRCLSLETTRICCVKSETESCYFENFITEFVQSQVRRRYDIGSRSSFHYSNSSRLISSLAGDDKVVLEDFPSRHDGDSISESDDPNLSVDVLKGESEKKSPKYEAISGLTQVVRSKYGKEVAKALDEWVEAGNEVTPTQVSSAVIFLQRRGLFNKALEMYEWLESREKIEFTESEYACRVDLIAKVQGLFKAEEYIQQIPESFRTEVVYGNLLRNCVIAQNVYKSEKFNKMKGLFPLTVISCNQMLFLYRRTDPNKIAYIMEFMEKKSIKPSNITYQILIDVEGHSGNIIEMEEILETMKSNGMEPSLNSRKSMAEYYAASGLRDKAEAVLKDMEGGDLVKNRAVCCFLILAYASLGREDEVERIWRECESDPDLGECVAAVKAWGKLKRIEDAEAALDKVSNIIGMPSSKHYAVLLNVYADHKMVSEGEDLFRRLRESGVNIRVHAWDALVKLFLRRRFNRGREDLVLHLS